MKPLSSSVEHPITNYRGDILSNFEDYINYYDAYGNERRDTVSDNPFGYCGEYTDAESGLIYLRNRYYDPTVGRFINEDPYWNQDNCIYGEEEKDISVRYSFIDGEKVYYDRLGNIVKTENFSFYLNDVAEKEKINKKPELYAILQSENLYVYCMNNPVKHTDSTGFGAGIEIYAIRKDKNSTSCEIWLAWSGGEMYSSWKFNSITVTNGNFIFRKTYATINRRFRRGEAGYCGNVCLGTVDVPVNDNSIRIETNGLMGFNMQKGWQSASMLTTYVIIK